MRCATKIAYAALTLALGGCGAEQADTLGSYLPVLGERCNHGICLSSSEKKPPQPQESQAVQPQEGQPQTAAPTPAQATPYDTYTPEPLSF